MTDEWMFYGKSADADEERIRRDGLIRLRKKVLNKSQKYNRHTLWGEDYQRTTSGN